MASSVISSNSQSYQMLLTSLQAALSNPLYERCYALSQLLQDAPIKELQYVFPSLVENIFGFHNGVDWGLLSLEKDLQVREFESLRRFLGPSGPVLQLIHKFTEEFTPKFEFPLSSLPMSSQLMMREGKMPALYINKLQMLSPGVFPSTLQLNALEFYFFNFTYFIVNPIFKKNLSTVNQQDTLYAHILEEYLFYFLPTDNRTVPLLQQTSNAQHSPILTSALSSNYCSPHSSSDSLTSPVKNSRPDFLSPLREKPSLLKKGTVLTVQSPHGLTTSHAETWRSEVFVLILKEMFLNQNTTEQPKSLLLLIPKTFIPSHYHVWMVRIMVKHLHFFFNSSLAPNQASGHGQIMIDSLGRLKSLGMTQLFQKEIYCFLKSTFDQWPLDASFRVPLETYLSYIQPWRYVQCDLDMSIWQKFMSENLLFYTTIFQQILKRFLRMDLSCPKNAYMLFRLTKVICTNELREMIMQAERGTLPKAANMDLSSYIQRSPDKYSFRRTSQLNTTASNYLPLFCEPVFVLVTQLLSSINAAREKCSIQYPSLSSTSKGFYSKVCSFFETSDEAVNSDDNSPTDIQKTSTYLESSSKNLSHFFKEVSPPPFHPNIFGPSFLETPNKSLDGSKFRGLSTREHLQLLNNKKQPRVPLEGNPDLQPVRTYEVAFLVHALNEVSQRLNDTHSSKIQQLYHKGNLLGKLCRRVLLSPTTYYDVHKFKDMSKPLWKPIHLPPRLGLRILANRQLIAYFLLYLTLAYWRGYHPVLSTPLLLLVLLVLLFLSAVIYPEPIRVKTE